jgi:hypothetical protein
VTVLTIAIHWASAPSNASANNSSRLTNLCAVRSRRTKAATCVAAAVVGKSNASLLGCIILVVQSFAGNTTKGISLEWFKSLVL